MPSLPEADAATRVHFVRWLETFSGYVREVDYAAARPLFHPDIVAFGTHRDIISGCPARAGRGRQGRLRACQRLEQHRKDPSCASCHATMDPLGFALENFDGLGAWRRGEGAGRSIARRSCRAGRRLTGLPACGRCCWVEPEQFVGTVTEKLLPTRSAAGSSTTIGRRCGRSSGTPPSTYAGRADSGIVGARRS